MKTKFLFFATLLMAATIFNSCSKEENAPPSTDLTTDIVGTYTGTSVLGGVGFPNHDVRVTKISDTRVQVAPASDPSGSSTFNADLSITDSGLIISIPYQAVGTDGIEGNYNLVSGHSDWHGSYRDSDGLFSYSLIITFSGTEIVEAFQGY